MRKIILFMVYSLDGFIAGTNNELDWEKQDPEVGRDLIPDLLKTVDSMILGRVLYQGFEQAWPAMAKDPTSPQDLVEFAHWIEDSPKIVFSQSLKKVDWKNSQLISVQNDKDIINEVKKIKQQPGGDVVIFGGVRLAQTFARLGLIDEYIFKLQPTALGQGKSLFKDLTQKQTLKLIKSKSYKCGVVALHYQPQTHSENTT